MYQLLRTGRFSLVATLAIALAAPAIAAAGGESSEDWQGSATGTTTPGAGGDHDEFGGYSAPFGPFQAVGLHVLNPATGHFQGSAVWTASGGDTLNVSYSGNVTPSGNPNYPYAFKGVLSAKGGTGRLSHAKGSATWMVGFTGGPGNFFFVFDGTLENAHGVVEANHFKANGTVGFTNILDGTNPGGIVPYSGV